LTKKYGALLPGAFIKKNNTRLHEKRLLRKTTKDYRKKGRVAKS
jgi:hypothetical protein